jgi:hypothetical protein
LLGVLGVPGVPGEVLGTVGNGRLGSGNGKIGGIEGRVVVGFGVRVGVDCGIAGIEVCCLDGLILT